MAEEEKSNPTVEGFERAAQQAKRQASHLANTAGTATRKTAASLEEAIRGIIENQPYTAVVIALGIGWLMGRMHRPL